MGRFVFQGLAWYFGDRLKYVCDNNEVAFGGKNYKGRKVLSVDELAEIQETCIVLIAASEKYSGNIAHQLKGKGIKNIRLLNGDPVTRFMDVCFAKYAYEMLPKVWQILEDEISKALILERLCEIFYHIDLPTHAYTSVPQALIPLELEVSKIPMIRFYNGQQYFPKDLDLHLTTKECLVDGGAYIGDTIDSFIKVVSNEFEKIYAFEIESGNYEKCRLRYEGDNRIEVVPYGLSDSEKEVFLSEGDNNQNYRASSRGKRISKVVPLDSYLEKKKVSFIKMDIEGEELAALEGSRNIIEKQHPTLAICAYHKASDIFDIPLWIKQVCPEYKIYLRHHSKGSLFETVCYGIYT